MGDSPKRRGDKRERTRAKLIAATLEVIAEAGFASASLEAIAARAGVTRGSIYSNFAGRDALMLAAIGAQGMQLDRDFSRPMPLKAQLRGFAERLLDQLPAGASGGELVIGYALYAMTQPQQRAALAATYAAMFTRIATDLEAQYGARLAIDARRTSAATP
jgi:AcrR family transcriptional regulator